MKKINVLLAGSFPVYRQGLKVLLETESDIVIVGEADNARRAVDLTKQLFPMVVILDLAMAGLDDVEAVRQIINDVAGVKVLVLTRQCDDKFLHQLREARVTSHLLNGTTAADLINAVRESTKGGDGFKPTVSNRLSGHCRPAFLSTRPVRQLMAMLTSREVEIWQLIAEGHATKEIAGDLFISVKTVEKHRQSLMNKLNIHHAAGLTRYAIAEGLIKAVPDDQNVLAPWNATAMAR